MSEQTEPDEPDTIAVFTARGFDQIVRETGSESWVLKADRASLCKYLVVTQNRHNPDHESFEPTEPHGTGFLIGKISKIERPKHEWIPKHREERWAITISEYARIDYPGLWQQWRNPVRYTTLEELGVGLEGLTWEKIPDADQRTRRHTLTIPEAKAGLAATYGVRPESIEIVIRG